MEDEDEDSLKTVEYSEEIRHDDWLSVDVEQTKCPGWTKQHDQHHSSFDPRSTIHSLNVIIIIISLFIQQQNSTNTVTNVDTNEVEKGMTRLIALTVTPVY